MPRWLLRLLFRVLRLCRVLTALECEQALALLDEYGE